MAFGILRYYKRHWSALKNLEREANRTGDEPNKEFIFTKSFIDWSRTKDNYHLVKTDDWSQAVDNICERYGARRRNDSVCIVDTLYSASPDWLENLSEEDRSRYFRDCLDFHVKHFCSGQYDLVLNAVVHVDETSVHMAVASVPLIYAGKKAKKWRLNAKKLLGRQQDYRDVQEQFFLEVGRKWGLEHHKPKEESRRHHVESNQWIAEETKKLLDKMNAEFDKEKQHIDDYIAAAQHKEDRLLQNLVDESDDVKSFVVREWVILQNEYPDIAEAIHARNAELKRTGRDKGYLPKSAGRPREVRGREHDR